MSDPLELRVLRRVTTLLETNVTEYVTDAGDTINYALTGRVWRGRTVLTTGDAAEALSLLEAPVPDPGQDRAAEQGKLRNENFRVLLQGWPVDDKTNPSDPAYYMKAAVTKALSRAILVGRGGEPVFPDDYLLGRLVGGMTVGQGVVRPAAENGSRLAMFYIPLVFNIQTDLTNP